MNRRILLSFLIVLFSIMLVFSAFSESQAQVNWWDKFGAPQYGGTITVQLSSIRPNFDPASFFPGDWFMVYEALIAQDTWTLDRAEYGFKAPFVPQKYFSGELAEKWSMSDPQTLIINLRQGIKWQNKPPVNGRDFTAYDVQAHYDRCILSPNANTMYKNNLSLLESVKATDKYTIMVKFKKAGVAAFWQFTDAVPWSLIEAPEYAALAPSPSPPGGGPPAEKGGPPKGKGGPPIPGAGGPLQDWRNIVGTGPWMITDYVAGSSMTLSKNPDYWGYDERHPENKLPYAGTCKALVISDIATSMAALRTGKIDIIGNVFGGQSQVPWQQAQSIVRSNPEILQAKLPGPSGGILFRMDKVPFNDIRVRQALNMAIDRPSIAKGYYGGTEDGQPAGVISPAYKGFTYPYTDWSQELKNIYSYNPARAKQLLAEAGYPQGFKTNVVEPTNTDLPLIEVLKANLMDIGVDMEIITMEPTSYTAFSVDRRTDQMLNGNGALATKPANLIFFYYSKDVNQNRGNVNDAKYDALVDQFLAAQNEDEIAAALRGIDKYSLEQAWQILVFPVSNYVLYQPYLKGYSGEDIRWNHWYYYTARWWIDQSLKK